MVILKFGGSSVGAPDRIQKVLDIIISSREEHGEIAVVFSAFQGVTDQLIGLGKSAAAGRESYADGLAEIEQRHISAVQELISEKNRSTALDEVSLRIKNLTDVLHGVYLIKELTPRTLDFIMSFGERLSAYIISQCLLDRSFDCEFLDTRKLVRTDEKFGSAKVHYAESYANIRAYEKNNKKTKIITGFLGSTHNEETTTIGRGGSDYTAAIFGAAYNAAEIQIWTDVDGVLTADPRKVRKAFSLAEISYNEAMEMSHFGAKVVHPPTMQPAMYKKIPIRIKNTFNPTFPGTLIKKKIEPAATPIKGISSIDHVSLLRVQGSGLFGASDVTSRVFDALARRNINVIIIVQGSSEFSLCMAVPPDLAKEAKEVIEHELRLEISERQIGEVIIEENLSVIAVVGENMSRKPGTAGRVFRALGRNGVNIVAIAQGPSELNITGVVERRDEKKALNVIHEAFFLSGAKTTNLYIMGTGTIGGTLLKQIRNQNEILLRKHNININVIGIANLDGMFVDEQGIRLEQWEEEVKTRGEENDIDKFIRKMKEMDLANSIFVDCTASQAIADRYLDILESRVSIATPNKKANTGSYKQYEALKNTALRCNVKFNYETNVGAGLPVINTLSELLQNGDEVVSIEGIFSGTLSYIFNEFTAEKPFSQVVKEAMESGYTEPDPRDDLNGMDVARKLLILAREAGFEFEMDDLEIENLVPEGVREADSVEAFLEKLKEYDGDYEKRRAEAEAKGEKLRYIARLKGGKATVQLESVGIENPFYQMFGTDNKISYHTNIYSYRPMVITGPGAGAEVTAGGVLTDILRIADFLS